MSRYPSWDELEEPVHVTHYRELERDELLEERARAARRERLLVFGGILIAGAAALVLLEPSLIVALVIVTVTLALVAGVSLFVTQ